jgi:hypothetical protein
MEDDYQMNEQTKINLLPQGNLRDIIPNIHHSWYICDAMGQHYRIEEKAMKNYHVMHLETYCGQTLKSRKDKDWTTEDSLIFQPSCTSSALHLIKKVFITRICTLVIFVFEISKRIT